MELLSETGYLKISAVIGRLWTMGLMACIPILIVLATLPFLKKYPKFYSYSLWVVVIIRLLCPVLPKTPFRLLPEFFTVTFLSENKNQIDLSKNSENTTSQDTTRFPAAIMPSTAKEHSASTAAPKTPISDGMIHPSTPVPPTESSDISKVLSNNLFQQSEPSAFGFINHVPSDWTSLSQFSDITISNNKIILIGAPGFNDLLFFDNTSRKHETYRFALFSALYVVGVLAVSLTRLIQYFTIKHRISTAVRKEGCIWLCETIQSPFVIGVFRPKIILPYCMDEKEQFYVIQHEKTHIKHYDPLIRAAGLICTCLYWWNPLVWFAVHKMNEDMEMFCDESTLRHFSFEERKSYAMAMLSFAAKRSGFSIGLAFGKSNTERRVVNIMKKRKNNPIILCFALLLVAFCAVAFVTLPKESDARTIQDQSDDGIENNDKNSDADNDPDAQKIPTKTDCPENSNQKDTENPLLSSVKEVVQKEENLNFLKQISLGTPDFSNLQNMDDVFWENYLFYTYASSENYERVLRYTNRYHKETTCVKVSSEEVDETALQIFGTSFSEYTKALTPTGKTQNLIEYENGFYYIDCSGYEPPDYVFDFVEAAVENETVKVTINKHLKYEETPCSQINLYFVPSENERGFLLVRKKEIRWASSVLPLYGSWTVTGYIIPDGINALSADQIDSYIGTSLQYGADYFQSADGNFSVPMYNREVVSWEDFSDLFGNALKNAGILSKSIDSYTLDVPGDAPFGCFVYLYDSHHGLVFCEGVLFRISLQTKPLPAADSWQSAYLDIIRDLPSFLVCSDPDNYRQKDYYDPNNNRVYLGIHDFDGDGIPELLAGDTISMAVFTFADGRAEKLYDLFYPDRNWCINGVSFKGNCISLGCSGSGGTDWVNFGFLDNKYQLGLYSEISNSAVIINEKESTLEELNKIYTTDYEKREETEHKDRLRLICRDNIWVLCFPSGQEVTVNQDFDYSLVQW